MSKRESLPESVWIDGITKLCLAYRHEGNAIGLAEELVAVVRGLLHTQAAEHAKEIEALKAELVEVRKPSIVEFKNVPLDEANMLILEQSQQLAECRAENERLRGALKRYGFHKQNCDFIQSWSMTDEDCSCGYKEALASSTDKLEE